MKHKKHNQKINRGNWHHFNQYLNHRRNIEMVIEGTLRMDETRLRTTLEWAGNTSLTNAANIYPTLPDYLDLEWVEEPLSPAYKAKIILAALQFGRWLSANVPGCKKKLEPWLVSLKAFTKHVHQPQENRAIKLEEMLVIARAQVNNLREERIRAAACLLFISGMRVGAFASLTLNAINLTNSEILQFPELGIRTKNGKKKTTHIYLIPDLLKVVQDWDDKVRAHFPESGFWFPPLTKNGEFDLNAKSVGKHRATRVRVDLKTWLKSIGLQPYSPHQFRHGFAYYGMMHSKNMADYKTLSENLMHSDISVTDKVYSTLTNEDRKKRLARMGIEGNQEPEDNKGSTIDKDLSKIVRDLRDLKELIKNSK